MVGQTAELIKYLGWNQVDWESCPQLITATYPESGNQHLDCTQPDINVPLLLLKAPLSQGSFTFATERHKYDGIASVCSICCVLFVRSVYLCKFPNPKANSQSSPKANWPENLNLGTQFYKKNPLGVCNPLLKVGDHCYYHTAITGDLRYYHRPVLMQSPHFSAFWWIRLT